MCEVGASDGLRPVAAKEASRVLRHVCPHPNPLPQERGRIGRRGSLTIESVGSQPRKQYRGGWSVVR